MTRDRNDPLWVVFAERLKHERNRRGLDQVELANIIGVSLRTVRNWERCHAWPPKNQIKKLIEILWINEKGQRL